MYQYVIGAAAGYVMGTKAGRKRYHQIVNATQAVVNSPVTKQVTNSARKALANKLDPEPRMREVKDVSQSHKRLGRKGGKPAAGWASHDQIFEPDED